MQEYIKINQADNVAVALRDFSKGEIVSLDDEITLSDDIARGHKFALKDIKADEPVIKYGFPIGYAKEDIKTGSHIHVHNLRTGLGDDLTYDYNKSNPVNIPCNLDEEKKYFMGYERKDGKAGVRNELWVIPTVGCVNSIAKEIASEYIGLSLDIFISK